MGQLFPDVWRSRTFPWTQFSIWRDHFYDKEWLFHLLLCCVQKWQSALGIDLNAPYNAAYAVVLGTASAGIAYAFLLLGVRVKALCLLVLPFVTPFFLHRMLLLRPHLGGIALFMIACGLAFGGPATRRRQLAFGILAFAYCYAYSNPHFVLVPAGIRVVCDLARRERPSWALLASGSLGLLLGMTLHPQFPATYQLWWVQCVDVVAGILRGTEDVGIGPELRPPGRDVWVTGIHVYALCVCAVVLCVRHRAWRCRSRLSLCSFCLLVLQLLTVVAYPLSARVIEYMAPVTVALAGRLATDLWLKNRALSGRRTVLQLCGAGVVVAALITFSVRTMFRAMGPPTSEFTEIGEFMDTHIPEHSLVATINWCDFPMIFNAAPNYRYLVALDPNFGLAADRERMLRIERCRRTGYVLSPKELAELLTTRYVFVSRYNHPELIAKMYDSGLATMYRGQDGCLFDLALSMPPQPEEPREEE